MNENIQNTQNTETQIATNTPARSIAIPAEFSTLGSISGAITYLKQIDKQSDYAKSVMYNALSKLDSKVFEALNVSYTETKKDKKTGAVQTVEVKVDSYVKYCKYKWDDSQSYVSKMVRVADRFIEVKDNFSTPIECKDDSNAIDFVPSLTGVDTIVKDGYGFDFTLSAYAEMLRFSNAEIKTAIEEDLIDSTTPSMKVRDILEKRFKAIETTASESTDDNTTASESTDGNTSKQEHTDTYTVADNDLAKLTTITAILETLSDDFKEKHSKEIEKFAKFIHIAVEKAD